MNLNIMPTQARRENSWSLTISSVNVNHQSECSQPNLSPWQGQYVFLITKPSLQPMSCFATKRTPQFNNNHTSLPVDYSAKTFLLIIWQKAFFKVTL